MKVQGRSYPPLRTANGQDFGFLEFLSPRNLTADAIALESPERIMQDGRTDCSC